MLGWSITPETYGEIRELGETGLIEPAPVMRNPNIDEGISVWLVSYEPIAPVSEE